LTVLVALLWPHAKTPPARPEPSQNLTMVSVMDLPKPPGPPDAAQALAVRPTPPQLAAPKPNPDAISVPAPDNSDLLSEAQLAGATSAGEGGGGGGCDLARTVQQALRRDTLVRTAVEGANRLGKAIMLWNGDWVQTGGQDGKGLSAAREAITWEVAFAPEACRHQRMHGVVLLSLADGSTRFAIGSGDWRWSDLLGLRPIPTDR
jgi:hypothetical protein